MVFTGLVFAAIFFICYQYINNSISIFTVEQTTYFELPMLSLFFLDIKQFSHLPNYLSCFFKVPRLNYVKHSSENGQDEK